MRIAAFEIKNYKGLEYAQLDDLREQAVILISGRNGTGKSLILEALVSAWLGRYAMNQKSGPWASEVSISLSVTLTDDEFLAVVEWAATQGITNLEKKESYLFQTYGNATGWGMHSNDGVINILRNDQFQRQHTFAIIDFLPANRVVPLTGVPTVNLQMLNSEQVANERFQHMDQAISQRAAMNLQGVANYLVTLDYQALLAQRQGLQVDDDYQRLAKPFALTTGKELLEPEYDPARGSNIEILLPTGHRHGLTDLSSGEQGMLAMMYFVRRLSAAGGILLLDEPEQHLHPTLQAALLSAMEGLAERAQIFIVSHSVNLIATAPISSLLQVAAPSGQGRNQIVRVQDQPEKAALIADLGLTAGDLFQHDLILVVEGESDAQRLRQLFPVEIGRCFILVAGSARQVIDAYDTLNKSPEITPWLCLIDRDLMSDEARKTVLSERPNLHVWPRRAIESLLLDGNLIAAVMNRVGHEASGADVEQQLESLASRMQDEVLAALVDRELKSLHPNPEAAKDGNRFQKMQKNLEEYGKVQLARAQDVARVTSEQRPKLEARWADDWKTLVEPKGLLKAIFATLGVFKTPEDFERALLAHAREHEEVRPTAFEDLRLAITARLARPSA